MKRNITVSTKVSEVELAAIEQEYDSNYLYKSDYYRQRLLGFTQLSKDVQHYKAERDNLQGLCKNQKKRIRKLRWTIFVLSAVIGSLLTFLI